MRDVEQQSAGGVGNVGGAFAGQLEADVVLREHDGANAAPVFRFVFAHPQKFGEGEIGERGIAGELNQLVAANTFGEFSTLLFGTHIAPDQRRANGTRRRRRA